MNWLPRKTIVVPLDFSDQSIDAVNTALEIADEGSQVHVVHVLPDLQTSDPSVIWQTIDHDKRGHEAKVALRQQLSDSKYGEVTIDVEFGDPGYRIAEFAKGLNADLIVMPSHGRAGIQRLLIGSVAERVIRLADCPVLVLRN